MDGLRAAGWHGDAAPVAYAFNTAAALRSVFATTGWPVAIFNDRERYVPHTEQCWQRPLEQIFEHWAAVTEVLLQRAER